MAAPKGGYTVKVCAHPGCSESFNALKQDSIYCAKHRYKQSDSYRLRRFNIEGMKKQAATRDRNRERVRETSRIRAAKKAGKYIPVNVCEKCGCSFETLDIEQVHCFGCRERHPVAKRVIREKMPKGKVGRPKKLITSAIILPVALPEQNREVAISAPEENFVFQPTPKLRYTFSSKERYDRFVREYNKKAAGN